MSGWICLHRGWRDSDVFAGDDAPLSDREAWVWLLEHAAWKDTKRRNLKGEVMTIRRGQYHTSLRTLGEAFGWGKNKVDRYLGRLVAHEMIGTASGQSGLLITICNYEQYQSATSEDEPVLGTAAGQPRDTQEQGKQTSGDKSPSVPKRAKASKPAMAFEEDWQPEQFTPGSVCAEIIRAWEPGKLEREVNKFRDHHIARGNRFPDRQAAWRTWVQNSEKFGARNVGKSSQPTNDEPVNPWVRAVVAEQTKRAGREHRPADEPGFDFAGRAEADRRDDLRLPAPPRACGTRLDQEPAWDDGHDDALGEGFGGGGAGPTGRLHGGPLRLVSRSA